MYGDRVPVTAKDANEEANAPYEVVFIHSTSATTCYGCKGCVRDKPSAPFDLFIRHEERRVYNRAGETRIRISSKPSCTGLHEDDVEAGRLVVSREVHRLLTKVLRRHLCKEFKLELD